MTKQFDILFEKLLSEVLIGSAKRNKRVNTESSIDHLIAKPRNVKRGVGMLKRRTIGQSHRNDTGKISKDPRSKNVYKTGHTSKRDFTRVLKTNYDGGYEEGLTNRHHVDRRDKLNKLKD